MNPPKVVLDTNVIIAALRSRRGASFRLVSLVDSGKFETNLSVPLVLEYEATIRAQQHELGLERDDVEDFLDYLCHVANLHEIYFLWRPVLQDPGDEMVLELAVGAGCRHIVTYNKRDFRGVERFGVEVITPKDLLEEIGALS